MTRTRETRGAGGAPAWEDLPTEARHPGSCDLDRMATEEVIGLLLEEGRRGIEDALRVRDGLVRAAERLAETLRSGGSVLLGFPAILARILLDSRDSRSRSRRGGARR